MEKRENKKADKLMAIGSAMSSCGCAIMLLIGLVIFIVIIIAMIA